MMGVVQGYIDSYLGQLNDAQLLEFVRRYVFSRLSLHQKRMLFEALRLELAEVK